jgi:hypothetical protein
VDVCAARMAGITPHLGSLDFLHDAEMRSVLGHHTSGTALLTESMGQAHLHLSVLIGRMPSGFESVLSSTRILNPAVARAEGMLIKWLTAQSGGADEAVLGRLQPVQKVCAHAVDSVITCIVVPWINDTQGRNLSDTLLCIYGSQTRISIR